MNLVWTVCVLLGQVHIHIISAQQGKEEESTTRHEQDWHYDVTWFQLEPEDSFIIRNKDAQLTCRAANALKVFFKCNGQLVPKAKQEYGNFTHGNTGAPITEVTLNVSREDIQESFSGDSFRCECVAWNKRGERRSQSASVVIAYLKKYFEQAPYSKNIEMDSQTELRCIPPDGVPLPVISWLRDGRVIDPKRDPNYIITADGHLLIAQTRLSDMGNYSCVAENIAVRRVSEAALLTVYVNGGWSPWSPWTDCSGPCGKSVQKRTRMCNSPAPLNGGRPCAGSSLQKQECEKMCPPVDGRWSSWSSWSICGPDCKHHRRRTCTNPPSSNGGRPCKGNDSMTNDCSGGLCKDSGAEVVSIESTSHSSDQESVAETDMALYIGLGVAITVFTIVALVVVRLMRKKGRDHVMYDVAPSDYPPGYFPDPNKKLQMQPDLTVNASTASSNNSNIGLLFPEYTYPANNPPPNNVNNPAASQTKDNFLTPEESEHHYDVPHLHSLAIASLASQPNTGGGFSNLEEKSVHVIHHLTEKNSIAMATSVERLPHSLSSDSVSSSFDSSCPSRPNSLLYDDSPEKRREGNEFRDSIASTSLLLEGLDPECCQWAHANSAGCRVTLKDSAVNLTIPEGAVTKAEELFCAILTEDKDRPQLSAKQTLLSAVLSCGPRNVHLKKPAILSFQHCAALKYGGWTISLLHQEHHSLTSSTNSSSENYTGNSWKKVATVGEETSETPVFIQLDANQVFLVTDRLDKFALVGESQVGKKAVKTLRLAVFAPTATTASSVEFTIRVYVLDDTIAALERVQSQEKRLGGRMLDKPRSLLFQDGGDNLCISLEDIGAGWKCKASYQEMDFADIWGGSHLIRQFSLEKTERRISAICFRLLAYQHVNYLQKLTFRIRTELCGMKNRTTNGIATSSPEVTLAPKSTVTTSSGCSSMVTLELGSPLFRLPHTLKKKLCQCLDQKHPTGKDWRLLAHKLGVDRYTNFLSMKASPTEHILDLWDVKNRKPEAITDLLNALRLMERQDAVAILEKEMGPWI